MHTNHNPTAFTRSGNRLMMRFGFGEITDTNEESGTKKYENGHIEFSSKAFKHATQEYPKESPAGAVALCLADVGGVDLSDYVDPEVDQEAVRAALEGVDGVGEDTADEIMAALNEVF